MSSTICLADYQRTQFLGQGTYGVVYKAKSKKSNQIIAVKNIKLQSKDQGIPSTTLRQISILRQLAPHPNIIYLKGVIYQIENNKLDLVFEYTDYDLKKYLASRKDMLSKQQIKMFMYQLICGVDFCHSRRIIHRDLKPQNILVTQDQIIKIADFGLARAFTLPINPLTHQIQTLWYRAPQILLGQQQYSLGVDIWAVGCIFAELIEKKALFRGDSQIDQIFRIFNILGSPNKDTWPGYEKLPYLKPTYPKFKKQNLNQVIKSIDKEQSELLQKMLEINPLKRISMKQALKDKYFDDVRPQINIMYERLDKENKEKKK